MRPRYALSLVSLTLLIFVMYNFKAIESGNPDSKNNSNSVQTVTSVKLDGNNISSFVWSSGVIDQDNLINNFAGFEWIKGSGKTAIFAAGLTLEAYLNNQLRMAAASYKGEYQPGYCVNGAP